MANNSLNLISNNDENSFDVARQSSSILQDSLEEEERDSEMQEVTELREMIAAFQHRVEHSEKQIDKFTVKIQVQKAKREDINEFDIYELDSFHKKQSDFVNNLEIALYKLSDMASQIKSRYGNGYQLLDVCEQVFMRKAETEHCLALTKSTLKVCETILGQQSSVHVHQ